MTDASLMLSKVGHARARELGPQHKRDTVAQKFFFRIVAQFVWDLGVSKCLPQAILVQFELVRNSLEICVEHHPGIAPSLVRIAAQGSGEG